MQRPQVNQTTSNNPVNMDAREHGALPGSVRARQLLETSGPSVTRVERRYAPAEATVVMGKIVFEMPIPERQTIT